MTDQTYNFETAKPASLPGRLNDLVRNVFVTLSDRNRLWRQRRLTLRQLRSLDDRQLADIGFERVDIERHYPTLYSEMSGWPLR